MAVGFSSYGIARSGLMVSERGLNVTGHNISNVDTPGYVRQQSIAESSPCITVFGKNNYFQYGTGADIQETRQLRNIFLDNIYRQENTSLGYHETRSKAINDVEAIINDPMSDGLQKVMNQFWDSWHELSKAPESLVTRALVRERGQALVYYFNQVGTQLDRLQNDLNSEILIQVDKVNSITRGIAALNQKIASQEIAGDSANDYRDQRNVLLDDLSRICDAQINEMQDGQVDITLDGYLLVSKGASKNLYVEPNNINGNFYYPMLEGIDVQINIKSGKLKGLLESRGEVSGIKSTSDPDSNIPKSKNIISDIKIKLNAMLNKIATQVNSLQQSGKTLDKKDGVDFFKKADSDYPLQMGNIALSDALTSEDGLNNIVASKSTAVGDNTIAREIANLRDVDLLQDSSGMISIDEYYRAMVLDIGNQGSEATIAMNNQQILVQSANEQRTAISGVSMDEEMSNMMKYKFAYDASARVLNIIDSMVEKVVNSMGIVGR